MIRSFIAGLLATFVFFAGQAFAGQAFAEQPAADIAYYCKYAGVSISGEGTITANCDPSQANYVTLYGTSTNSCKYSGGSFNPAITINGSNGFITAWCADPFAFTSLTGQALSTVVTSNSYTVSGFGGAAVISVANGEYQIDSGNWTSATGTVSNTQTVRVRHTTSAAYSTPVTTTLTIGGVSGTFTSTTLALDTTPDPFSFTALTAQALNTMVNSSVITVSGINAPASISIAGGEYSINGGAWSSATGTVNNGQTVSVRHTTSAVYETTVTTTLTIGGVPGIFSSTTLEAPGNSCKYSGVTISSDGSIRVTCDPNQSYTATLYGTSAYACSYAGSAHTPAVSINSSTGAIKGWCASTANGFTFTALTGQALSTSVTSNAITVSGFSTPVPISIMGGEYQIDSSAWSSAVSMISDGQTVRVRHTTSAAFNTAVTTTLTIGDVSGTFVSTTGSGDTTPDPFTFTALTEQPLNTQISSNSITVAGINAPAVISIANGEYQINSGAWSNSAGTVTNGQTVRVRHTTSAAYVTTVSTTLTIGGVNGIFSTTTQAVDTTPDPFSFTPQSGAARNTEVTSNAVTITGINTPVGISVSGGTYSVDGGAFTNAAGTLSNGQSVRARVTTSNSFSSTATALITIGNGSGNFTVTTGDGKSPVAFGFTSVRNAARSTWIESNTVTLIGLSSAMPISVTGGQISINGGAYSSATGSVNEGSTVRVRQQSSAQAGRKTRATVSVGTTNGTFDVTTKGGFSGGMLEILLLD